MFASQGGHVEVVRLLLEAGAEKDCNDRDGITAVMLASAFGRFDVVRLLVEAGVTSFFRV